MVGTASRLGKCCALCIVLPLAIVACGAPTNEGAPASRPGGHASSESPATAAAGPAATSEELKAQLDRLAKDQGPIKTNWMPPGKGDRYGHAEGIIAAPYETVKGRLLDFPHYKELAGPKFKKVSVVDKGASTTDLYFQLPIMKGLVTIWYVTRFSTARPAQGGAEVIEGKFVKGNIKDTHLVFTLRPGPNKDTILVCDLDLALNLPAPQAALDEELRDACGDAVNAVRARVAQPAPP